MTNEIVVAESHDIVATGPNAAQFEDSLEEAAAKARSLKRVISENRWSVNIRGQDHIRVEAWITLASGYGCTAKIVQSEKITGYKQAYMARAEVLKQTPGGIVVVGGADAECGTEGDEPWASSSPAFAVRSMAQTRAISKAISSVFRWVVVLAGYNGSPYEEMPKVADNSDLGGSSNRVSRPAGNTGGQLASVKQKDFLRSLGYKGDDIDLLSSAGASEQITLLKNLEQ